MTMASFIPTSTLFLFGKRRNCFSFGVSVVTRMMNKILKEGWLSTISLGNLVNF
jgi:hypothetical protein